MLTYGAFLNLFIYKLINHLPWESRRNFVSRIPFSAPKRSKHLCPIVAPGGGKGCEGVWRGEGSCYISEIHTGTVCVSAEMERIQEVVYII